MMTPDGQCSASMPLGKHQTIKELFNAIKEAFRRKYEGTSLVEHMGRVLKIEIIFSNMGPLFMLGRVLELNSDDDHLIWLRHDIVSAFSEHRKEDDVVVGRTLVRFEDSRPQA